MPDKKVHKKLKYESPTLISLGEVAKGFGAADCTSGYSATSYCTAGNAAATACTAGGIAKSAACSAGTLPGA